MSAGADGAVTALIDDLYAAVLAGDHARFDRHLAPDVTIWESHVETMMHGIVALTAYRDARDEREGSLPLVSLAAHDKLVEVFDGVALIRYRLVAGTGEADVEFRVTDVLRDDGVDGWRIVHHHAERRSVALDRPDTADLT